MRSLICFAVAAAFLGCGRGNPLREACPQRGDELRNGRCVPSAADAGARDGALPIGQAQVDVSAVDFGSRVFGSQTPRVLRIINPDAFERTVRVLGVRGDGFFVDVSDVPLRVPPMDSLEVTVVFSPFTVGDLQARLELSLCREGCPGEVALFGRGVSEPLECEPVNFGAVAVNSCENRPGVCRSVIDNVATVQSTQVVQLGSPFRVEAPPDQAVPSRGAYSFSIEFCPIERGVARAVVALDIDAGGLSSRQTTSAQGRGIAADACVFQVDESIDFGALAVDSEEALTYQIESAGDEPCEVIVEGIEGRNDVFRLLAPPEGLVLRIPPGERVPVRVAFSPPDAGEYEAAVVYQTNDPEQGRARTALTGTGVIDRSYRVTNRSTPPFVPTPGRTMTWVGSEDDGYFDLPIPFSFEFLGRLVPSVRVSTNGFLTFVNRGGTEFLNQPLPSRFAPNALVAVWWDDLVAGLLAPPGRVTYRVSSESGQNILHIAYIGMTAFSVAGDRINAEVRLYEGSNNIEIHYGEYVDEPSVDQFQATVGWEDFDGTSGADLLGCGARCEGRSFPSHTLFLLEPIQR